MDRDHAQLWVLRVLWFLGPLVAGTQLRSALVEVASPGRWLVEAGLWLGWFVGAVALLTPHPVSLTAVRVLAPTLAGVGVLFGFGLGWNAGPAIAIGYGAVLTGLSLLPSVGDIMVNGSAYGSERRMALRTPGVAFLGPIPLAWLTSFVGLTAWAPALIAWSPAAGVAAGAIGAGLVWIGTRVLHQLARRWIVFVPAGFVVHDPFQLAEPVLLPRGSISRLGPAELGTDTNADSGGLDLSAGSLGLALEVETDEPLTLGVLSNRNVDVTKASKLVFSPTLPGALLSEARIRGIKIKGSSGAV